MKILGVEALRVRDGHFRAGTGPFLFGNLQCTGMESRLTECNSSYSYTVTHSDDAGVRCQKTEANSILYAYQNVTGNLASYILCLSSSNMC